MDDAKTFQPAYNISWATFLSVLERMAADPPTRVDRTYLHSQSGFIQTYLIAAYKAFGFLGEDSRPTDLVNDFADPDRRKDIIADLFRANYPTIIPLGETNSTPGELAEAFAEAFPSITGESRRKAVRFFLSGAEYAGIKTSPMWKAPKAARGSSAPRRSRKAGGAGGGADAQNGANGRAASAPSVKTVEQMKAEYFALLLKKAEQDDDGGDLLDRIERLVGISTSDKKENRGRKTAGSKPATPADPASQGEG
jgi:hypothetical protein